MDVLVERCCGFDVHKDAVVTCVRTPGNGSRREQLTRSFGAAADTGKAHQVAQRFLLPFGPSTPKEQL
jgi:hypothetical protein